MEASVDAAARAMSALMAATRDDATLLANLLCIPGQGLDEIGRATTPAWDAEIRAVMRGVSATVRRQAERLLSSEDWLAATRAIEDAPHVWITDDGALKLEWRSADRSLGIFFEENERDSGWAFAATAAVPAKPEWGTLKDLRAAKLFRLLRS